MSHRFNIIILLFIIVNFPIFSQQYLFDLEVINIEDGLPHRNVWDIVQDRDGFIWMSAGGTISRYDGHQFKVYDSVFLKKTDVQNTNLAVDVHNNIWYCESRQYIKENISGIIDTNKDTIYSIQKYINAPFKDTDVLKVRNLSYQQDAILIITQQGAYYKYDGELELIFQLPFQPFFYMEGIDTPSGGYYLTHATKLFRIENQVITETYDCPGFIQNFFWYQNELWMNIYQKKMIPWKLKDGHFQQVSFKNYPAEDVQRVFFLNDKMAFFLANGKYIIQDWEGNQLFEYDKFRGKNLDQFIHGTIYHDQQGNLWSGTKNGLLKVSWQKNPFTVLEPNISIRGICKIEKDIWIGGYAGNNKINQKTGIIKNFYDNPRKNVAVTSFYKDVDETYWLGTSARYLLKYIPQTDELIRYTGDVCNGVSKEALLPYRNLQTCKLWIGTNMGLTYFDEETEKFHDFPLPVPDHFVHIKQIFEEEETFWLVTSRGIFIMDKATDKLVKHHNAANELPNENLNFVYKDSNQIYWLGSKGGGLIRWDKEKNKFKQYRQQDGIFNQNIYAVYEDDYGNLWLPSDYGLMCFNKKMERTRLYLPQDGIAHEEFNTWANYQDENGKIYFGGLSGVTVFHPKEVLRVDDKPAPLHITGLDVWEGEEEVFVSRLDGFKKQGHLVLEPDDKIVKLNMSLLDFESHDNNRYAYLVEGRQNQWVYTKENNISLINLPYGNYNLRIKGSSSSKSWSGQEQIIPLIVRPPFYLRWRFIIMVFVLLFSVVFIGFKWRINQLKNQKQTLENEVKKRTQQIEADKAVIEKQTADLKSLDIAKTRFFSNITHEFRTPLTLILGPLEQLKEEYPPFRKKLNTIFKNARHLLILVNQLLDLSKLESGKMEVEVSYGDVVQYTQDLIERFHVLAQQKEQQLTFSSNLTIWKTNFDKKKWDKIIYNLLSNAIKFTSNKGSIAIILNRIIEQEQEVIQLIVKDSGIGIESTTLLHIFNRFYQTDSSSIRYYEGTGIGLALVKELVELQEGSIQVESELGLGTTFEIHLPIPLSTTKVTSTNTHIPTQVPIDTEPFTESIPQTIIASNKKKLTLLIIEDNEEMRQYIRSCIDDISYHIMTAKDGQEGIEQAQQLVPDLIISDIMMPRKNGFEVVKEVRQHLATSHIPIILLTAKASLESRLEGINQGADVYLTKPFNSKELRLRIQKLIELRQSLQHRYQNNLLPDESPIFQKEDAFISTLKDYVHKNIDKSNLNVQILSKHLGISRTQLYRKLDSLTGKSVAEYVRDLRLEKAKELLIQKEMSISEIAFAIGFSSASNFSRTFKKIVGSTPSSWNQ